MRLSRRIFVIAILLTSGLMAANEVPELLTLSNNVSNDYELACQRVPGCSAQLIVRSATRPARWLAAPASQPELPAFFSSTTFAEEMNSPPLSVLGVQRK
jgi:hypothetical protein